jgi:hypothetical protein
VVLSNKNSASQVLSRYYQYDVILKDRDSEFLRIKGRKNEQEIPEGDAEKLSN